MFPLLLLASLPAAAQEASAPLVPSVGLAAENGPGALWVNPANLAFDPDPRFGFFYASPDLSDTVPASFAGTVGAGGLGVGVSSRPVADGRRAWSLDYVTGVALQDRFAFGTRMAWHLVGGGQNFLAYDFGATWRPLPWIGAGAVARNVGTPDPSGLRHAETGAGLALRPLGDAVVLGADWVRTHDPLGARDHGVASARLRPLPGLYLRGHYGTDGRFGGGVEVYFDGVGVGALLGPGRGGAHGPSVTGWIGTDEPGESLVRSGRRVPSLYLAEAPDYEPRGTLFVEAGPSWLDTLELLRRAEEDPGVRGLVLSFGRAPLSWARFQELRQRITALEGAGKPVFAYLDGSAGNGAYWAASAASRVALHPAGGVDLTGFAAELTFFAGTLDLVGVEAQFVRAGEYKSAIEQHTRAEPSGPSLEQTDALLDGLYGALVDGIADGRGVDRKEVEAWVDGGPWSASEALDMGLVDVLAYPDEIESELEAVHDGPVRGEDLYSAPQAHSAWEAPAQIAVVYVTGAIVPGESSRGGLLGPSTTGSWTVVEQLDRARRDPQVRAVVLRVDSPGGSAFASDEIWRGVHRLKESGKPVVVSMGGVAASGGYYVSAGADAIWAEPTTITGSIGVYSGKFAVEGLMDDLGVSTTTRTRGRNATIYSPTTRWDDDQRARMQSLVDQTYAQFKDRVAEGRDLSLDEVEEIARGRVWTGEAARERGLVDALGGLQDAVADARDRAGLPAGREVALVSYSSTGAALSSLSPALVRAFPRLTERRRGLREELEVLRSRLEVLDPLDPAVIWTLHPEESVWMMSPWRLEIR